MNPDAHIYLTGLLLLLLNGLLFLVLLVRQNRKLKHKSNEKDTDPAGSASEPPVKRKNWDFRGIPRHFYE